MSDLNFTVIKQGIEKKTTEQLIDILSFTQDDYREEAIPIISEVLIERGVDVVDIEKYKHSYKKLKKRIDKADYKPKYKTPVIVTLITMAIGSFIWRTSATNYLTNNNKPPVEQVGWDLAYTDTITNIFKGSTYYKSVPEKYKSSLCDCYIDGLKQLYPNGLKTTMTPEVSNSVIKKCENIILLEIK